MTKTKWPEGTGALLDEILTDAYGDDEQLWAIRQAFEDNVKVPADAFVIGEPVEVVGIDYDGNNRRGLTARCRRQDGGEHVVTASEVVFPDGSVGATHVAAYRKWIGLEPIPQQQAAPARRPRRHKTTEDDLDLGAPIKLIVLAPKKVGTRIGELSLKDGFDGVLAWGLIDNRPFLRCMHGFGLCLWRLDGEEEAAALFERMLWLNPTDNQGIRFLLHQIRAAERWEDRS